HFSPSKESGSISHSNIHGLLLTGDTLWIGTFEHGLDWLDINTGKVFKHFDASSRFGELSNNFVLHMIKTRDGGVLLATSKGIYNFDPKTGIFNLSPHFPGHLFYTTLYQSPSGVLWAGTWRDGVFYYDPDQKEGGSFKSTSKEGSLPSNRINRIFEDSEKRISIATEGGLSKHHFSSKTFKNY